MLSFVQNKDAAVPVVDAVDLLVVVDEGLDGVDDPLRHLVHLVEDEEALGAAGDVAADPVLEVQLKKK